MNRGSDALAEHDETLLTSPAPRVTEEGARSIAIKNYDLNVIAKALTSERDRNFYLEADDGRKFVLKITNASEDPAVEAMQTAAMLHVATTAPNLPIPRPCKTATGDLATAVHDGDQYCTVRLFTYLPGEPLHKIDPPMKLVAELGRSLALLGEALQDFRHPAGSRRLLWDLQQAARLRPLAARIEEERLRAVVTAILDRYENGVVPLQFRSRSQIVHNDLNPYNVLIDSSGGFAISGILDFGDMVHTPLINDVAVGASYQVEGPAGIDRMVAFVRGYHMARPLMRPEIEQLYDLIMLRQAMTIIITSWRASLYPDNGPYILRNRPRAILALDLLVAPGRDAVTARLLSACEMV